VLLPRGALGADEAVQAAGLALDAGRLDLARGFVERAREGGAVEGVADLDRRLAAAIADRGREKLPVEAGPGSVQLEAEPSLLFGDVGGLDDVKKVLHRLIVLPQSRPELLERYGRRAGGGVLLYGPPGCGKTLLARAIAGECGLPFLPVRIETVLDPYFGSSERNLAAAFEAARASAPCVLFFDEVDALGFARHRSQSDSGRRLADVLLQQLDSVGTSTDGMLVLAATNAPWDVDDALLRPGRFDRRVFVPPPDEPARARVLEVLLREGHSVGLDPRSTARRTELFSGADLRAVVERAVDAVIDEALATGTEPPLRQADLDRAVAAVRPTTLDWLLRARDYVEFANAGERWSDIAAYLGQRQVRRRLAGG
jgi:SpoVK/Ycf46/Vps4 family AAA+-type ATPase